MEPEKAIFVSGLYLNRVSDKAPAFIITNQSLHVDTLIKWLQENKHLADEKGYLKLVGKESKNTDEKGNFKRYFQVDTYKPAPKNDAPVTPEYPQDLPPEAIPF